MDEARIGLIPTTRRIWAKVGRRPTASSKPAYVWRYDYAFVHPATGRIHHWLWTTVDLETMGATLAAFAADVGVGPHKQVVIVLDGAGWHSSSSLVVPPDVRLVHQPPYSPELQPTEKLFPLVNEALANREYRGIDHLVDVWNDRVLALGRQPDLIRRSLCFHWWPKDRRGDANGMAS